MQDHQAKGNPESAPNKVVSIFSARQNTSGDKTEAKSPLSFDEVMRKNAENLERMRRERLQANKGVLKSYRIKD